MPKATSEQIRKAGAYRRHLMRRQEQKTDEPAGVSLVPLTARELTKTIECLLRTYYEFSYCSMRTPESVTAKLTDGTTVKISVEFTPAVNGQHAP